MIVECINDNWEDGKGNKLPSHLVHPIKGNIYEVIYINQGNNSDKAPYYGLHEIRNGIVWSHKNFREVDINIDEIKEALEDKVEV